MAGNNHVAIAFFTHPPFGRSYKGDMFHFILLPGRGGDSSLLLRRTSAGSRLLPLLGTFELHALTLAQISIT